MTPSSEDTNAPQETAGTARAIYRRYRPATFADVAGQEHITQTLRNAVRLNRVARAYLLAGPRGSGKTTTARILAKAVNCLDPQEGDACNSCGPCNRISQDFHPDVTEADAASNRRTEHVREILATVPLAPIESRRKLYIIDEAHMLTGTSANVLSEALENAPAHVHFVLCTTDPDRLPSNITSRCQQMLFRRIPIATITKKLSRITAREGVAADTAALETIAQDATGSMRDAESTLEKLLVTFPDGFTAQDVTTLTGTGTDHNALSLIAHMAQGNPEQATRDLANAQWQSSDLRHFHSQVSNLLRGLFHIQSGAEGSVNLPEHVRNSLRDIARQNSKWNVPGAIRAWHSINLAGDPDDPAPMETAAVQICRMNAPQEQPARPHPNQTEEKKTPEPWVPEFDLEPPPTAAPQPQQTRKAPEGEQTQQTGPPHADAWNNVVRDLSRTKGRKYNLGAILRDCRPQHITLEDNRLTLPFRNPASLDRISEELSHPESKDLLKNAIQAHFGPEISFQLTCLQPGAQPG